MVLWGVHMLRVLDLDMGWGCLHCCARLFTSYECAYGSLSPLNLCSVPASHISEISKSVHL